MGLLVGGRHGQDRRDALQKSKSLVVSKEECFVALDRAVDTATKLVQMQLRLVTDGGKVITRVEGIVARKFECRAMKLVGTGFSDDTNHCTRGSAHFSSVETGLHTEFGNGIDGRPDSDGAGDALVVVGAVQQFGIEGIGLTICGDRTRLPSVFGPRTARYPVGRAFIDACRQLRQLHKVATVQRKLLYGLLTDNRADRGGIGLQGRRRHFNFDSLLRSVQLECGVKPEAVSGGQRDMRDLKMLEAGGIDADRVGAVRNEIEDVLSFGICCRYTLYLRFLIDKGDGGTRHNRLRWVGHGAEKIGRGQLRHCRMCAKDSHCQPENSQTTDQFRIR